MDWEWGTEVDRWDGVLLGFTPGRSMLGTPSGASWQRRQSWLLHRSEPLNSGRANQLAGLSDMKGSGRQLTQGM